MPPFYAAACSDLPGFLLRPNSASVAHIELQFFWSLGEQLKNCGVKEDLNGTFRG